MSVAVHPPRLGAHPKTSRARPLGRRARRVGLAVFFASVSVNAALGIYAVLAPGFGETQGKVLATSLCVTGAVLLALACEPAWERCILGQVPISSAMVGAIGFALTIGVLWIQPESDAWGKTAASILTIAVVGALASLLALARLAPPHAWVSRVTLVLLAVGGAMYASLPWLEDPGEWFLRSYGVVMIVLAAFVVSVPVLHWMDRGALAIAEASSSAVRFCPYCGRQLEGAVARAVTCGRCGRAFMVTSADGEGLPSATRVST